MAVLMYAKSSGMNDLVIMVASHHTAFYEKIFSFERMTASFTTQYCSESVALRMNVDHVEERFREKRTHKQFDINSDFLGAPTLGNTECGPESLKCVSL